MIEEIHKSFAEVYDKGYVNGYKDAKKKFDRPRGEWSALEYGYKCSACTAAFYTHSNFCPNCGADMRKSGETE